MSNALITVSGFDMLIIEQGKNVLRQLNEHTMQYGLSLTDSEIADLSENHLACLKECGRIEFGAGNLPNLVNAFCDSPYLQRDNYAETLNQLQEAFYYYKDECLGVLSDNDLLHFMAEYFNNRAHGSIEVLLDTGLEELCRDILYLHAKVEKNDD